MKETWLSRGTAYWVLAVTMACLFSACQTLPDDIARRHIELRLQGYSAHYTTFLLEFDTVRVHDRETGSLRKTHKKLMCFGLRKGVLESGRVWWVVETPLSATFDYKGYFWKDSMRPKVLWDRYIVRSYDLEKDTYEDWVLFEPEKRVFTPEAGISHERVLIERFYLYFLYNIFSHDPEEKGSGIDWIDPSDPEFDRTWLYQMVRVGDARWFFGLTYPDPEVCDPLYRDCEFKHFMLIEEAKNQSYGRIDFPRRDEQGYFWNQLPVYQEGNYVYVIVEDGLYRAPKEKPERFEKVELPGRPIRVEEDGYWYHENPGPGVYKIARDDGRVLSRYGLPLGNEYQFLGEDGVALWFKTSGKEVYWPDLVRLVKEGGAITQEAIKPEMDVECRWNDYHLPYSDDPEKLEETTRRGQVRYYRDGGWYSSDGKLLLTVEK